MNENETTSRPCAHVDVAWGAITRRSRSRSFIEDQLAGLVGEPADSRGFRVDVIHIGPANT